MFTKIKLEKIAGAAAAVTPAVLGIAAPAWACSVCYGNPASPLSKGLNMGIICLLAVLIVVLGSFSWFFIQVLRRSQSMPGN